MCACNNNTQAHQPYSSQTQRSHSDFKITDNVRRKCGARSLPISLLQMTLETTQLLSLVRLDLLSLTLSATRHGAPPIVDTDTLINYLIQRVFNDPLCSIFLQCRDKRPHHFLVDHSLNREPAG